LKRSRCPVRIAVTCLALFLGACQSLGPTASIPAEQAVSDALAVTDTAPTPVTQAPPSDLWERLRRDMRWHEHKHAAIRRARDAYLAQPQYLDIVGHRARRYLHYIVEEVEARGMPMEIALLPLVESALDPFAISPQQAAGLWQIMPATAQYLGMRRDWWYDERLDLRESTRVALDYLQSLHDDFDGDWLLALAAYNAGKSRVARAVRHNLSNGQATDYWSLDLPRETRHYVPRLLALSSIVRHAEELTVELPQVANAPAFLSVSTGGQIELQRAAQLAGVQISTLRNYNPGHLRWATAPVREELLLPAPHAARFRQGLARLPDEQRVRWSHYRIRSGDNLGSIARRFGTQVALLREVNGIEGHFIRAGDTLLIPRGG